MDIGYRAWKYGDTAERKRLTDTPQSFMLVRLSEMIWVGLLEWRITSDATSSLIHRHQAELRSPRRIRSAPVSSAAASSDTSTASTLQYPVNAMSQLLCSSERVRSECAS